MPPPFWMHCNICAVQYNTAKKFYMMSCQHTFCRECMKFTDNGKKCPLDKKEIKFEEVTKLKDKQRQLFQPQILTVLNEPRKMINFQKKQQKNYMNLIKSYKKKYQKATQMKAKMEQECYKLNVENKKIMAHRQLMQEKLKHLHQKRPQKNSYRAPYDFNSTGSTNSTQSTPNTSSDSPGLVGNLYNTAASLITPEIKKSQNSRSPFFV